MKEILKRKLKNARGASLIIAMVFMLICVFVGGSVLTAATMNAYRIEHHSDAQDFLDQRSAALLVMDELKSESGTMTLLIHDSIVKKDLVEVLPSGMMQITEPGVPRHQVTFSVVGENMTAFQRTAYETAVRTYLSNMSDGSSATVILENFKYNGTDVKPETMWMREAQGTFKVEGSLLDPADSASEKIADFEANFKCDSDYHYTVNFGTLSQMEISMRASKPGVRKIPTVKEVTERDSYPEGVSEEYKRAHGQQVSTTTKLTTISWQQPRIEKGMS